MSYFIKLQSTNHAPSDELESDPFTGLGIKASFVDLGLTSPQRSAVIAMMQRMGGRRLGVDDRVELTLHNGSLAEVHLVGLYTATKCVGGQLSTKELSLPFLSLAVELAAVAKLILRPQGFPRPLVTDEILRHSLIYRYPQVQSVFSAPILWNLLKPRELEPQIEAEREAE